MTEICLLRIFYFAFCSLVVIPQLGRPATVPAVKAKREIFRSRRRASETPLYLGSDTELARLWKPEPARKILTFMFRPLPQQDVGCLRLLLDQGD